MEQGVGVSKLPVRSIAHGSLSVERGLGAPLNHPPISEEEVEQSGDVA